MSLYGKETASVRLMISALLQQSLHKGIVQTLTESRSMKTKTTTTMERKKPSSKNAKPRIPVSCTDKFSLVESHFSLYHTDFSALSDYEKIELRNRYTLSFPFRPHTKVELKPEDAVGILTLRKNVGEPLNGKYFLARCLTPAHFIPHVSIIMTVVDDPKGIRAVRLFFTNFSLATTHVQLDQILPVGTILIIRNPWAKLSNDNILTIGCTNPAEAEIIPYEELKRLIPQLNWVGEIPEESMRFENLIMKTPDSSASDTKRMLALKNMGNKFFVHRQFTDAIRFYTEGLKIVPNSLELLANRGASYINLSCFNKALEDIDRLLKIDPFHVKGIFRKVKALWGLKRFTEVFELIEEKCTQNPYFRQIPELENLIERSDFIMAQHAGNFDMLDCLMKKEKLKHFLPDFADYMGPVGVAKQIAGKGRGLCVTKNIEAGQLLMACTAFAVRFSYKKESNADSSIYSDKSDQHKGLVNQIAHMIHLDPELGDQFYKLFAGPKLQSLSDDSEIMNEVDMQRIDSIVTFNSFAYEPPASSKSPKVKGIWIFPSLINHSCSDANCDWIIIGDLLMIRAIKPIPIGGEVLISYANACWEYERRKNVFLTQHHFTCNCELCEMDKHDDDLTKGYSKLAFDTMKKMIEDPTLLGTLGMKALQAFSLLESLRMENSKLNMRLTDPIVSVLARTLFENGHVIMAAEILSKVHSVMKDTALARGAVEKAVNILGCYIAIKNKKMVKKWVRKLKHDLIVAYGSLEPIHFIAECTLKSLDDFGVDFFATT